jgi:hypothetical protein
VQCEFAKRFDTQLKQELQDQGSSITGVWHDSRHVCCCCCILCCWSRRFCVWRGGGQDGMRPYARLVDQCLWDIFRTRALA